MSQVFISYRQIDDAYKQRVRQFAERIRDRGIDVVFDQFYLEEHPGGPPEKWTKWCSDQAIRTANVIIIGSHSWFQCFDLLQKPGTGLGSACEADDLRTRIYDAAGINNNIRVVLFEYNDAVYISTKLKGYHYFQADLDFDSIVDWLSSGNQHPLALPNNLPRLFPYFGRATEKAAILAAIAADSNRWGILITGGGGMGKTSLAVSVAASCRGLFDRVVFVSMKERDLDDSGVRHLGDASVSGFPGILNEVARELGKHDLGMSPETSRAKLLTDLLRSKRILLIFDNLESMSREDREKILSFLKSLPTDCKAILTSRELTGNTADSITLQPLDSRTLMEIYFSLSSTNINLKGVSADEVSALLTTCGGNPLLLRWIAGQVGRGECHTISDAITFLESCPVDNDPLEFIFGDLANTLSLLEEKLLSALSYLFRPVPATLISSFLRISETEALSSLNSLANRSLVVFTLYRTEYRILPIVTQFLKRHDRFMDWDMSILIMEKVVRSIADNKTRKMPLFERDWPLIESAIPLFLDGSNHILQQLCRDLTLLLDFSGRWDEALLLYQKAEARAVEMGDYDNAGWRSYNSGRVYRIRNDAEKMRECASRARTYWTSTSGYISRKKQAKVLHMYGTASKIEGDFADANWHYHESLRILNGVSGCENDKSSILNALADLSWLQGDEVSAEAHYSESIALSSSINNASLEAIPITKLATLKVEQGKYAESLPLAERALKLADESGRDRLIAEACECLAKLRVEAGHLDDAVLFARRAVDIFSRLRLPEAVGANSTLRICENKRTEVTATDRVTTPC